MKKLAKRGIALVLFVWMVVTQASAVDCLIPGGQAIGLELAGNSLTVAAYDDALSSNAKAAGLQIGDQICSIDGKSVHSAQDVRQLLKQSQGSVELEVNRKGKSLKLELQPQITQQGPKLGVYLKQGVTGVGTVTWYDPQTETFGALGHGVNDASGALVPMETGTAYRSRVLSVKKGQTGTPGQLMATADASAPVGTLYKNVSQGIFGTANRDFAGTPLPIGQKQDVHCGEATILCTVTGDTPQSYCVEILKIYPRSGADGRNLLLKVTDQALLATTGGIVQGMSGSPIIQDGKLVGAVTHVLVNDPTTGYGIFIENMLDAAA